MAAYLQAHPRNKHGSNDYGLEEFGLTQDRIAAAFGDYIEQLVFLEPRSLFPEELEEGMGFEGLPPGCNLDAPKDVLYTVTDIYPDHVVLDGNHPLAGMALRITMTVQGIREASEEEIGRGSAGTGFFKLGTAQA